MTEQRSGGPPQSRRRSVGFPLIALQDAVDAVVTAGQNGPDHTQDAFATYLGHKTTNSGAFRAKLASLRDWGLIERGDRDRVKLSSLAQELVLAAPDHYQSKDTLLAAFESCRVFGMVYNDSAKNVAMDVSRLRTQILMRYGVASDQADKFVDSFIRSAVFAGVAEADGSTVTLFNRDTVFGGGDPVQGDYDEANTPEPLESAAPNVMRVMPVAAEPTHPVALRQNWPIEGGEIEFVIRTPEALPPSIYSLVAEMAEVAEKMKAKLTGSLVEITTPNSAADYQATERDVD